MRRLEFDNLKRAKSLNDIELRAEGKAMFCHKELSGGISNQKIRKM
jgi:hypothetical protein